jgi:hypothetical protein
MYVFGIYVFKYVLDVFVSNWSCVFNCRYKYIVGLKVLTAVTTISTIVLDGMPRSPVEVYLRFVVAYCLYLQNPKSKPSKYPGINR